jgi:aminoglycoside phosphotransferase
VFDVDPSGFEGVNADTLQAILDAENERVRIQWIRALAYAIGQYRKLAKDKDIDELSEQALGGLTILNDRHACSDPRSLVGWLQPNHRTGRFHDR